MGLYNSGKAYLKPSYFSDTLILARGLVITKFNTYAKITSVY